MLIEIDDANGEELLSQLKEQGVKAKAVAAIWIGIDEGSPDGDCTVTYYRDPKTGEYRIHSVEHNSLFMRPVAS